MLEEKVCGFADTLPAFREHASQGKHSIQKFKLEHLVDYYLNGEEKSFKAHDASEDVAVLAKLCQRILPNKKLMNHSRRCDAALDRLKEDALQAAAIPKLTSSLVGVSASMVRKIASSGLQFEHLSLAFERWRGWPQKIAAGEEERRQAESYKHAASACSYCSQFSMTFHRSVPGSGACQYT